MLAVVVALEQILPGQSVTVYSDSQYVIKGITEWIAGWKRNGWRTSSREPVKNAELWRRIDTLLSERNVRWQWVKGHNGHPGNEAADALARQGMKTGASPPEPALR